MMIITITTTVTSAGGSMSMSIIGTGMHTVIISIKFGNTIVQVVAFQQVRLSFSS